MRPRTIFACLIAILICSASGGGAAAQRARDEGPGWFPTTFNYGPYLADLRLSAESLIGLMSVADEEIPGSGSPRTYLKAGGLFGVYRHDGSLSDWQIDIAAALASAQFDLDNSYDNIGWDGIVGVIGSWVMEGGTGFRFGWRHDSSHVGDEYAERTGRLRIDYTREEFLAGIERFLGARLRVYGEAAWATTMATHEQDPLRLQVGGEFKAPGTALRGHGGWYGALNLASYSEKDFQVDVTVQGGVFFDSDPRQWRLAVTLHHGTVTIGEFFEHDETYVLLGVHLNP